LGTLGQAALTTRRLLLTPLRPQDAGPMAAVARHAGLVPTAAEVDGERVWQYRPHPPAAA
jgi:hypothetical protein